MAKIKASVGAITDKDGNPVDPNKRSSGAGKSFALIPSDFYLAVVKDVEFGTPYFTTSKDHPNKARKDKKWETWKLKPNIQLLNDNATLINRQDIQLGTVHDGAFVRPDADKSKSNLWSLGQFFLGSLGLLNKDEAGNFVVDFDTDLIMNRVVKVRTAIGGYIKGEATLDEKVMHQTLLEANDGMEYEFEQVQDLIDLWNEDHGYTDDDKKLKAKNIITNFYAVDVRTIDEEGFYLDADTGGVFTNEAAYNTYLSLKDIADQQGADEAF